MDDSLAPYEKIYKDTDEILGKPFYHIGALIGRSKDPTTRIAGRIAETVNWQELIDYASQFLTNENAGIVHTMIIVLKPYRDQELIKDIFDKLVVWKKQMNKD